MVFKRDTNKFYMLPLTISAISIVFCSTAFGAVKAYSNGSSVNIRSESSTSSEALGKLQMNEPIEALGIENDFIRINYAGREAYVSSQFVTIESDEGYINGDNVNVRVNGGNEVAGQLNSGDAITITGRYSDSLVFEYNGQLALVHSNYVNSVFKDKLRQIDSSEIPVVYAEIISDSSLNLRGEPNTDAEILAKLPSGDILDVIEKGSDWTKIRTHDDRMGYVSSEFVDVKTGVKPERPSASKGAEVIAYAKQFIGTPYRYGGTNLNSGVDCSGFVYAVYRNFGISLNRTSSSMPANGTKVSKSELVAGDLVFFSNGGAKSIQHVGIYCGDGTFIHSATGGSMRVMISGMGEAYYVNNYITAARVLN